MIDRIKNKSDVEKCLEFAVKTLFKVPGTKGSKQPDRNASKRFRRIWCEGVVCGVVDRATEMD